MSFKRHLARFTPDQLTTLVSLRPDLADVASDPEALYQRATSLASIRAALLNADETSRRIITGLAAGYSPDDPILDAGQNPANAVNDLRSRALIGPGVRLAPQVKKVIGPYPAQLAPQNTGDISGAALDYQLASATRSEMAILHHLAVAGPVSRRSTLESSDSQDAVDELIASGLLRPHATHTVIIPRTVAMRLRGERLFPPLPHETSERAPEVLTRASLEDRWVHLEHAHEDGTTSRDIVRVLQVTAGVVYAVRRAGRRLAVPLTKVVSARPGPVVITDSD